MTDPATIVDSDLVAAVAALLPQRTLDADGANQGTFDGSTVPTSTQVALVGQGVAAEVQDLTGIVPSTLLAAFTSVVAIETASRVELGFFDDDARLDNSDKLHKRFLDAIKDFARAVANVDDDGNVTPAGQIEAPVGTFPTPWPDWYYPGFIDATTMTMRF